MLACHNIMCSILGATNFHGPFLCLMQVMMLCSTTKTLLAKKNRPALCIRPGLNLAKLQCKQQRAVVIARQACLQQTAPYEPSQDVASAHIGREHPVGDEVHARTHMIPNHLQASLDHVRCSPSLLHTHPSCLHTAHVHLPPHAAA